MFKALLRFILFICPCYILAGISYILFDRQEITGTTIQTRRFRNPDLKKQILQQYMQKCFKQVNKDEGVNKTIPPNKKASEDEKRLD